MKKLIVVILCYVFLTACGTEKVEISKNRTRMLSKDLLLSVTNSEIKVSCRKSYITFRLDIVDYKPKAQVDCFEMKQIANMMYLVDDHETKYFINVQDWINWGLEKWVLFFDIFLYKL